MLANYHTHTRRCHHASGRDEAYVKAAINKGIKIFGFADHGPFPYEDFKSGMRMTVEESRGYIKSLRRLREKYKDDIDIKIGFEYEYFPDYFEWMKKFIEENGIDYAILGQHFTGAEKGGLHTEKLTQPDEILRYRDAVTEAIKTKAFLYVAHPDLYLAAYPEFDETARTVAEDICRTAKEYEVPLEYNLYGLRKSDSAGRELYPSRDFWLIAKKYGNTVIKGIDAHFPKHIKEDKYFLEAEENLKALGIVPLEKLENV